MRKLRKRVEVRQVKLSTRKLITIRHTSHAWKNFLKLKPPVGSLVRLVPPAEATDAQIAELRSRLLESGAKGVKVAPRASGDQVLPNATRGATGAETERLTGVPAYETPRTVIDRLISVARTEFPDELRARVQAFLDDEDSGDGISRFRSVDVGHLVGVRLENWCCYKGEQVVRFGPKVYSVTAQREDDQDRSNWLGKSSFLHAIVFAITGVYPSETADGWIHGNEPNGGVDLQFSSGAFISRWKERGKGTRVEVEVNGVVHTGEAADRFIEEQIVSSETLFKTSFFSQKSTDQFIRMGSADASSTINAWIGIDWIEDAASNCRRVLNDECAREAKLVAIVASFEGRDLNEELASAESSFEKRIAEVKRLETERLSLFETKKKYDVWIEHSLRSKRVDSLRESLPEVIEFSNEELELRKRDERNCRNALREANRSYELINESPNFDGKCPTYEGVECPAKLRINEMCTANRKLRHSKLKEVESAELALQEAVELLEEQESAKMKHARNDAITKRIEREIAEAQKSVEFVSANVKPSFDEQQFALNDAMYVEALRAKFNAEQSVELLKVESSEKREAEKQLENSRREISILRSAMLILGRTGAQRDIAEGALSTIELMANSALEEFGVDLRIRVSWSQELKRMADNCEHCGAPFPTSAKVKSCARCGSVRGKQRSNQLSIELSNRSGGADDLGGLVFKLAAACWLRNYRGVHWNVFLLDEPFGALDKANVRAVGLKLERLLLERFGASQAFVVAHHADVLESTPGRIRITNDGKTSKVENAEKHEG